MTTRKERPDELYALLMVHSLALALLIAAERVHTVKDLAQLSGCLIESLMRRFGDDSPTVQDVVEFQGMAASLLNDGLIGALLLQSVGGLPSEDGGSDEVRLHHSWVHALAWAEKRVRRVEEILDLRDGIFSPRKVHANGN